jgi:hypothetical protein
MTCLLCDTGVQSWKRSSPSQGPSRWMYWIIRYEWSSPSFPAHTVSAHSTRIPVSSPLPRRMLIRLAHPPVSTLLCNPPPNTPLYHYHYPHPNRALTDKYMQSPGESSHAYYLLLKSDLFRYHSERMINLILAEAEEVSLPFTPCKSYTALSPLSDLR